MAVIIFGINFAREGKVMPDFYRLMVFAVLDNLADSKFDREIVSGSQRGSMWKECFYCGR